MSTVQSEDGCQEGHGENAVQPEILEDNKDLSPYRDAIRYNIFYVFPASLNGNKC